MLAARSIAELVISARRAETSPGDPVVRRRAAIVAAIGPVVFTAGFAWTLLGLLLTPLDLYWRDILYNPAHQLMVAGSLISLICLPVAQEMLEASIDDIAMPDHEALRVPEAPRIQRRSHRRAKRPS